MHSQGFSHRDIKCDNVLLTANRSTAKLADFGLARTFFDRKSGRNVVAHTWCGTLAYMAPELLETLWHPHPGYQAHEADVWAMGVMLFKLLNNRMPFPVSLSPLGLLPKALLHL